MTGAIRATGRALDGAGLALATFSRPARDGLSIVGLGCVAHPIFRHGIQPWTWVILLATIRLRGRDVPDGPTPGECA